MDGQKNAGAHAASGDLPPAVDERFGALAGNRRNRRWSARAVGVTLFGAAFRKGLPHSVSAASLQES